MHRSMRLAIQRLILPLACLLTALPALAAVRDVSFENGQGITLAGKLYMPAGTGPFPAVIMMHGCAGVYANSDPGQGIASLYEEWAGRLNRAGYAALLVDSFTPRQAAQNQCGGGADGVSEVDDRPYDAAAAAEYLAGLAKVRADRIGALGWSHGGSSVMASLGRGELAGMERIRAGVSFYPGCGLFGAFGGISQSTWLPSAPFLILHAGADPLYRSGYCGTRLKRAEALGASAANGNPVHMTAHFRAKHSFDQANQVGDGFTRADVFAKRSADYTARLFLDLYLQR